MPEQPIQFGPNQQSGHEPIAGASPVAINCHVDGAGAVRRRPGLVDASNITSSTVDAAGIYALHRSPTGLLIAASGSGVGPGKLYSVGSGITTLYNGLYWKSRPTFAETEAVVVVAGDNVAVRRIDVSSPHTTSALGGSPPVATQVVANASRLLLNDADVSGRIWYSAPAQGGATAGHEQWSASITSLGRSGFFTAEARPDTLVALRENTNEVFAFGASSLQVFGPDAGGLVYSPTNTREYGCAAASSIIKDEQSFAWLDDKRRFVHSDGRSFQEIGQAVKAQVDDLATVSDCVGYRVLQGPVDALVWRFPTAGVTLAFQKGSGWSTWSGWDDATNNYAPFQVAAATSVPDDDEVLVGTTNGRIAAFSRTAQTDLGTRVPYSVTTGFISHGTDTMKHCKALRLALRRGLSTTEASALLEWRDDLGPWGDPLEVGLGATGDTQVVVPLRGLGVYRRRQWRFSFHGTEDLVLASAMEEFELTGY